MSPAPRSLRIETLLADAGWVRRLAARLVADPATAEDLAQQTLVAAWQRPPAEGTPARAWLARVLRNFARQRARSDSARAVREQSSALASSTPDDLLERAELAQHLARLVLELDEPYRTTVLRRFFDGWSAVEIARAEGTNPSTVRTRLERGLALLRERLERERGRDWMAALAPLVKITGGIAMGTGAKIGIGLCAAGLCGWLLWPRAEPLAPALEPPAQTAQGTRTALEAPATAAREPQTPEPAKVVKPVAQAPVPQVVAPGTIEGHVVRRKGLDELPIEGARVTLWPAGEREETPELPPEAETRSKADGSFHFAQLKPGDYALRAQVGRGALHETHARIAEKGPGVPVKIVFGGTRIHGHAYDEQGEALAGVPIRLDGGHEFQFELRARATTGERGEYSFDELPPGKYFGLATEDWQAQWPGRMWILTLVEDDDVELDLGEPRPLPHWRGSVRSASGAAVLSGGTVHLERVLRTKLGSEAKTYREVLFDGSAAFDLRLERGSWQPGVSLRSRPETRRMFAPLQISADDLQHDLVLAGARVHGTVFDSLTQKPLEGYVGTLQVSVRKARTDNPDGGQTVELEQGAQFAIDMLDEGEWEILTFPLLVAAGGHKLGFVIGSGETEKQVDVQVQKP